jgi:hypothetical protein
MPRLPHLISIAAISLFSARALAQSAEAEALFSDGDKAMKQHQFAQACDAFESSNRIEARAGTLIRLGQCREELHQLASAWSAYKDALTRAKDPKKQKVATTRIAAIEPRLSHLMITAPPLDGLEISRDGKVVDPGLWNHAIPINGGEYTITASAPGHATWKQTYKVPDERGEITVSVPKLEAEAVVAPPPVVVAPPTKHVDEPPPREESSFTTKRKVAVVLYVVGVGAVVTGALLGHSATGKHDDAFALCPDPAMACARASDADSLISSAHTRALEADVAFGAGALAAIVATTLWLTGSPEHPNVTAQVSSHGAGFAVLGSF